MQLRLCDLKNTQILVVSGSCLEVGFISKFFEIDLCVTIGPSSQGRNKSRQTGTVRLKPPPWLMTWHCKQIACDGAAVNEIVIFFQVLTLQRFLLVIIHPYYLQIVILTHLHHFNVLLLSRNWMILFLYDPVKCIPETPVFITFKGQPMALNYHYSCSVWPAVSF